MKQPSPSLPAAARCCGPAWTLALLLLSPAAAQDPQTLRPDVDYQGLKQQLGATPRPTVAQRIEALEAFRQRHADHPGDISVLRARLSLALAHLENFDAAAAKAEFAAVDTLAPQNEFDLHGRALYGMAQAEELGGDPKAAIEKLQELRRRLDGSRYADVARVALNRLADPGKPAVGEPLPALALGKDVLGRPVSLSALRGKPLLLVFFAIDHEASIQQLDQLAAVWTGNGMPEDSLIAFALQSDPLPLKTLVQRQHWRFPVLPGDDGFLHQDWMRLRVTGTPANWVVGRNGTMLLRDATASRLAAALKAAR